ncbi:hypothetical protein AHAS_Ahas19G0145000 [Arachis hypogaea]
MTEGVITQNVHIGSNLNTYYVKPMMYNVFIDIGRVHLIKYNSSLHLKGRKKRNKNWGVLSRVRGS